MAAKKNKKSATAGRREKIEEARRRERARDRRNRLLTIVASVAIVVALVIGGAFIVASSDDDDGGNSAQPGEPADITGVETWSDLSRDHVEGAVDYPMTPPAGGEHSQVWMNCDADVYEEEIPNENAVHSLEHGAVWVTYNDTAAEADLETLSERVSSTSYSLMSPMADQESPITLTAWGAQLNLDTADDPRVAEFFDAYVQGPQTPEPGAACTGGRAQ